MPGPGFNPTPIQLHATGKLAKTNYVNEVAQAVNDRGSPFITGTADGVFFPSCTFIAKVTDKGPTGEADKTTEDYWLTPQRVDAGGAFDTAETVDDTGLLGTDTILATNYGEQLAGSVGTGTHQLKKNQRVIVDAFTDNSDPPKIRYGFNVPVPASPFLFPVLTSQSGGSAGDTNTACSFTYNVTDYISGVGIGTNCTVFTPRQLKVQMTAATNGTACFTMMGTVKTCILWEAFEVMKQNSCA